MHDAARVFDQVTGIYESGRPSYPDPVIDRLVATMGIDGSTTVLDLAAGTGKLTRQLQPVAGPMMAVEPLVEMRRVLSAMCPQVDVRSGTAEEIPLETDGIDVVVVGQAFHWFDAGHAYDEIARVLRPGGWLGIVFNSRNNSTEVNEAASAVIESCRGDTPTHHGGAWRAPFNTHDSFTSLHEWTHPWEIAMDRTGFLDRFLSVSFVALAEASMRMLVREGLLEVFDDHARDGVVRVAYDSSVFTCRLRRSSAED